VYLGVLCQHFECLKRRVVLRTNWKRFALELQSIWAGPCCPPFALLLDRNSRHIVVLHRAESFPNAASYLCKTCMLLSLLVRGTSPSQPLHFCISKLCIFLACLLVRLLVHRSMFAEILTRCAAELMLISVSLSRATAVLLRISLFVLVCLSRPLAERRLLAISRLSGLSNPTIGPCSGHPFYFSCHVSNPFPLSNLAELSAFFLRCTP
jgi:hypothetical protein